MLRREFALQADAIRKVTLSVDEGHLRVCNIEKPQTGLEVKFSLRATNALALLGENTSERCDLSRTPPRSAARWSISARSSRSPPGRNRRIRLSEVAVHLTDGRVVRKEFDVGIPMTDLAAQGASLTQKFMGLAEPAIGAERASRSPSSAASSTASRTSASSWRWWRRQIEPSWPATCPAGPRPAHDM